MGKYETLIQTEHKVGDGEVVLCDCLEKIQPSNYQS